MQLIRTRTRSHINSVELIDSHGFVKSVTVIGPMQAFGA